jgi:hypothetical protein
LIEEQVGGEFAATFWVGEPTFDLEDAEDRLAVVATRHGLRYEGGGEWSHAI